MKNKKNAIFFKEIEVETKKKEKPSLSQYGLENTDIDQLTNDYNKHVEHEKKKTRIKDLKVKLGFIPALFSWVAPLFGVVYILNLIFKWDVAKNTLLWGAVYVVIGTAYIFLWSKWYKEAEEAEKGNYSLKGFPRKKEWESLIQYRTACRDHENWERKCNELFWEKLTGLQFEEEVAKLYNNLGYRAEKTRASNDGGVDIVLYQGKEKIAIQCKAYNKKISPSVARELYGVLCTGDYTSGIIATVNGASEETRLFCEKCKDKPIKIITVCDLIKMQSQVG